MFCCVTVLSLSCMKMLSDCDEHREENTLPKKLLINICINFVMYIYKAKNTTEL